MAFLLGRPPSRTLPFIYEDLGLEMVAASLRAAGIACRIDDGIQDRCSPAEYVERLANAPEQLIGLTLHSELVVDRHLHLLRHVKQRCPEKLVVVGGHPVAALHGEIAEKYGDACDVIVLGEGEQAAVELAGHVSGQGPRLETIRGIVFKTPGGWVRTPPRGRTEWHTRPHAARDAWERPDHRPLSGSALVAFSQGCNQRCTFCSVAAFHGRGQDDWRSRPLGDFLSEVAGLQARYGVRDFTIVDPNFIGTSGDGERLVGDFCDAVERAGLDIRFEIAARIDSLTPRTIARLRRAGMLRVFVGLESGLDEQLRAWRKSLTSRRSVEVMRELVESGVYVEIGMIVLQPETTLEHVRANLAFLRQLPYFNLYNLDQALWPLHVGDGRFNMEESLLEPSPERIFRHYRFGDDRVRQFAGFCAELKAGLGDQFYAVRKAAWDHLADGPHVLARFCEAQRQLMTPYLGAVERAIASIEAGMPDDALRDRAADAIEALRPELTRVAERFVDGLAPSRPDLAAGGHDGRGSSAG